MPPRPTRKRLRRISGHCAAYVESPLDTEPLDALFSGDSEAATCLGLKSQAQTAHDRLAPALEEVRRNAEASATEAETRAKQAHALVELLNKRRQQLSDTLASERARSSLASSLWMVILAIGMLSLGAIYLVKQFDLELQVEWVASGQVIQFVTVMVLLSVVMALGLSEILKEESLGTLLGAVAGYVLSQGVGRAVAREVTRPQAVSLRGGAMPPGAVAPHKE